MSTKTTAELADLYTATLCTLDGKPAVISGRRCPFALIRTLDGKGGAVEFAWDTVAFIVGYADRAGTVAEFTS